MGNSTLTEQLSSNLPSTDSDSHSVSSTEPVEAHPQPDTSAENLGQKLTPKRILGVILAVLPALGITLGILWFAPEIQYFSRYGYPGVFLISLIGNASIALPIPSL
ncbi:MAG: hypothetical protein KDJ65_36585, partial [Anaerolineae bacterium]|nr:hypothetical protein [Anaerolineae bacterium]